MYESFVLFWFLLNKSPLHILFCLFTIYNVTLFQGGSSMQSEQYSRTLVLQRNHDTCNHRRANHSNHQSTSHCQVNSAPNKCTRLNESGGIYLIKMSHESVKQKHTQTHTNACF